MDKDIWRAIKYLFNSALVVGGGLLSYIFFIEWAEIGFRIESKFKLGNQDGIFSLLMIVIGAAMFVQGIYSIAMLNREMSENSN